MRETARSRAVTPTPSTEHRASSRDAHTNYKRKRPSSSQSAKSKKVRATRAPTARVTQRKKASGPLIASRLAASLGGPPSV
eukprot:4686519-Prymnesium_polylepis.1